VVNVWLMRSTHNMRRERPVMRFTSLDVVLQHRFRFLALDITALVYQVADENDP